MYFANQGHVRRHAVVLDADGGNRGQDMTLKALLFDVDGTLADTESHGHLPAYNRAFRDLDLGWEWSPGLYRDLLSVPSGRERIAHYMDHYKPGLGKHEPETPDDQAEWVRTIHERKSDCFRQRLQEGRIPLRDGVERLLVQAHDAGLDIAIVTNASRATLQPFLEYALGQRLRGYIKTIVSGEQVAHKKPAPDLYRAACDRIQCQPAECVAIEDSAMGLESAHAAGIPAVVTVNEDTSADSLAHASLVVDSLGEPDKPVRVIKSPGFELAYVDLPVMQRLQAGRPR